LGAFAAAGSVGRLRSGSATRYPPAQSASCAETRGSAMQRARPWWYHRACPAEGDGAAGAAGCPATSAQPTRQEGPEPAPPAAIAYPSGHDRCPGHPCPLTSFGATRDDSVSRFSAGTTPGLAPPTMVRLSPESTSLTVPRSHDMIAGLGGSEVRRRPGAAPLTGAEPPSFSPPSRSRWRCAD
jgi:hypothetical protein